MPAAIDGERPRAAARWINLNARSDVVGGPMKGSPFAVGDEFLEVPRLAMGPWLDPLKAHASSFLPGDVAVNRDDFARFIETARDDATAPRNPRSRGEPPGRSGSIRQRTRPAFDRAAPTRSRYSPGGRSAWQSELSQSWQQRRDRLLFILTGAKEVSPGKRFGNFG